MAKADKTEIGKPQAFQAEVAKLLQLMVHSVYSDRDVFLRELISNASDALDKLRYEAIAKPELLEKEPTLSISITPDKTAKTLTISDTGIGMTADELAGNLGTIARSGTEAFVKKAKDAAPDLIGRFGVGFYAAFMVADKVIVTSRKAGSAKSHSWESDGLGTFTVEEAEKSPRGTTITLHLKDDASDFLDAWKIESVVKAYSDHIAHPIMLSGEGEPRQINSGSAIWTRAKNEVTAEQHKEFYSALAMRKVIPHLPFTTEPRVVTNIMCCFMFQVKSHLICMILNARAVRNSMCGACSLLMMRNCYHPICASSAVWLIPPTCH